MDEVNPPEFQLMEPGQEYILRDRGNGSTDSIMLMPPGVSGTVPFAKEASEQYKKAIEENLDDLAKRKQVGGTHYNSHEIQPIDIIVEYDLDFFEGNALKYLLRCKGKNGVEDLEKALHYLQMVLARAKGDPDWLRTQ
jgi:hypothetical protein